MATRSRADRITALPKEVGRRAQTLSATRRLLVDIALEQFTEHGYAATSLDTIVSRARVTKGALYHHFSGKQALFEAVFEKTEADAAAAMRKALKKSKDPWEKAALGLRAFLDVVQNRSYQRVVIQDGPAVLGYERFREQEERSSYSMINDLVRTVVASSSYELSDDMADTFSRIFFGAMSAAGESVTAAIDPEVTVARVEAALTFILAGLRSLAESGISLADPAPAHSSAEASEEASEQDA
ncbi:MAG: TetR/AcrR family transcriptional regulator [Marmoricola sp.]